MAIGAAIVGGALAAGGGAAAVRAAKVPGQDYRKQTYGGSKQVFDAYRQQYGEGVDSGVAQMNTGIGGIGRSLSQTDAISRYGQQQGAGLSARGDTLYDQGLSQFARGSEAQGQALGLISQAAQGRVPSAAELMLRQNAQAAAQQGQALATTARGGNQAAAMRDATQAAVAGRVQAGQQAAVLRAQEMAQARGDLAGLGSQIYGQGAAPAQMGLQAIGQGIGTSLGAQQFDAQANMDAGQYLAGLGAGREGQYLTAQQQLESEAYQGALEAERMRQAGQQRKSDRLWGLAGTLIGGGAQVASMGMGGRSGSK